MQHFSGAGFYFTAHIYFMDHERLESEMRFYDNCYDLAKRYQLNDETAANEAKTYLKLFVVNSKLHEPVEQAKYLLYRFEEYLQQW